MKKHSLKDWMIAVRPWSFPASSMPVVVTLAYLYWMRQDINWVNGIWALLNIIVFHAAGIPGVIILTISIRSMQGIPLAPRP